MNEKKDLIQFSKTEKYTVWFLVFLFIVAVFSTFGHSLSLTIDGNPRNLNSIYYNGWIISCDSESEFKQATLYENGVVLGGGFKIETGLRHLNASTYRYDCVLEDASESKTLSVFNGKNASINTKLLLNGSRSKFFFLKVGQTVNASGWKSFITKPAFYVFDYPENEGGIVLRRNGKLVSAGRNKAEEFYTAVKPEIVKFVLCYPQTENYGRRCLTKFAVFE